jgi:hypothetical protein
VIRRVRVDDDASLIVSVEADVERRLNHLSALRRNVALRTAR